MQKSASIMAHGLPIAIGEIGDNVVFSQPARHAREVRCLARPKRFTRSERRAQTSSP
jgi:hypothetical protein